MTRFVGMFAIGVWDRQTRTLHLIRDRIGVKPLYWCRHQGVLLFGSELKALMAHPAWRAEIDVEAAAGFIRYSYVPTPATIFREVHKLAPGAILTVREADAPRIEPYWRLRDAVADGAAHPFTDEREAADELESILRDSIRGRMIADVPLGAFLSGGIDSSTVVALMQAQSTRKVRTFSIGFREPGYDEAQHAKAVAAHLGTDHTELYVTARRGDRRGAAPAGMVRRAVRGFLANSDLSGVGDDAQARHRGAVRRRRRRTVRAAIRATASSSKMWRRLGMVPRGLRGALGAALGKVPEPVLDRLFALAPPRLRPLNGRQQGAPALGDRCPSRRWTRSYTELARDLGR